MTTMEFEAFPKIPRLRRDITITEKIDGTNAAVVIIHRDQAGYVRSTEEPLYLHRNIVTAVVGEFFVAAQSRTRFITPKEDNYGFARWVQENAEVLVETLGAGTHFGEWWGSGIQRKYGLSGGDKRFSLFNTHRWQNEDLSAVLGLGVVPVLYQGPFRQDAIDGALDVLRTGSFAAPGFMRPEGIIVYHSALRSYFKVLLEGDDIPKSVAAAKEVAA